MQNKVIDRPATVRPEAVVKMVASLFDGRFRPSDEEPLPRGPWDPVIRQVFGPQPEPWRIRAIAEPEPFPVRDGILDRIGLNPQPLPPRFAIVTALTEAAILRAELIGEAAGAAGRPGVAARYMLDLIDDWCGTVPHKFPWPIPGPRPFWAEAEIGPMDHLVMATVIAAVLRTGVGDDLAKGLEAGKGKLLETAMGGLG